MKLAYCQDCKKDVEAVPRVFGVLLCPLCGRILHSNIPLEKGGK